jgi:hypothetical protein
VKFELLRIGREVDAHDRAAAQRRANLELAGFVTVALQRRRNWPTRIFTSSALAAPHFRPPDRPPAASVDWETFINGRCDDVEVRLE